jgi:predicted RNase H-like nuclease
MNERNRADSRGQILGKVHEVDTFLRSNPECQGWIREVHLEVSFGKDDHMYAFAALWTAEQAHSGKALVLPPNPPPDEYGLRMEIVA